MKKIIGCLVIYGATLGAIWKLFMYPLSKMSKREDEWLERQNRKVN